MMLLSKLSMDTNAMDIWSVANQPISGDQGVSIHTMTQEEMIQQLTGTNRPKYKSMNQQQHELWIPSAKCWQTAIAILQKTQLEMFSEDASELCARLPEVHQKRLALEIAQCHFQDLSRPLYMTESIQRECSYNSFSTTTTTNYHGATGEASDHHQQNLQYCLKHLTDAGVTVYTTYVAFVQNLCIRLTQELILHYQRETQQELALHLDDWLVTTAQQIQSISNLSQFYADQSADITETVTQQMKDISSMYTEQLQALSSLPDLVKDQLIKELTEHFGETLQTMFDEQLKDTMSKILTPQVQEQATFFGDLMDRLQLRDAQHQTLYDEWTHYQLTMMQQQALELQRQRQMLDEHRHDMEHWSATMKPLFGLNRLAHLATDGYTWVTFLLHFLCTFLMVWVVTRPEICQSFRSLLFCVALSEAVLEMSFTAGVRYELWSEAQRFVAITELRKWAFFAEAFLYVSGLLLCGIFSIRTTSSSRTDKVVANAANNHENQSENNNLRVQHQTNEITLGHMQQGQDVSSRAWMTPMNMYAPPAIDSPLDHPSLRSYRGISHHSAAAMMPRSNRIAVCSPVAVYPFETRRTLAPNVQDLYEYHPSRDSSSLDAQASIGGSTWITPPNRNPQYSRDVFSEPRNICAMTRTAPALSDTEMMTSQARSASTLQPPPQSFQMSVSSMRREDENAAAASEVVVETINENPKDNACMMMHNRINHHHDNTKRQRSNDPEDPPEGKESKRPRVITAPEEEDDDDDEDDEYEDAIGDDDDFLPQKIVRE